MRGLRCTRHRWHFGEPNTRQIDCTLHEKKEDQNKSHLKISSNDDQVNGLPALGLSLGLQNVVNFFETAMGLSSTVSISLILHLREEKKTYTAHDGDPNTLNLREHRGLVR